jgi:hypothetical protein
MIRTCFFNTLEQATGIEPAARPWEGRVLPLYDACNIHHFSRYPLKNKDKFPWGMIRV